jgi:hypothetical protein
MQENISRAALLLLAFSTLTACKSKPPAPATPAAAPARPAMDISRMTDEQLVAADQSDGLGLALRIPGNTTFHSADAIPLHILMENFGARIPIASGMCSGVALAYEDTATSESGSSDLAANPRCIDADPFPETIPLERGKIKTVDLTSMAAAHLTLPPGHYLLSVTWKAIPAGPGTLVEPVPYATLRSNPVPVTIIQ